MTRINCGIPPYKLTDKHLLAEHREIKRIPNCISKGRYSMKGQPNQFVLGTGHVKFFYDKLGYLLVRYNQLYEECVFRGFNIKQYNDAWDDIPNDFMGNYEPTKSDINLIQSRIDERLKESGNYTNTRDDLNK